MKHKSFNRSPDRFPQGWRLLACARLALALVLAISFLTQTGAAQEDGPSLEYPVKAAFLVKFAAFTEWPGSSLKSSPRARGKAVETPLVIGLFGKDPFGTFFDNSVKTNHINGRTVELRRPQEMSALAGCQIVYVAESENSRVDAVLHALEGKPVLTVSDAPDFARRGGMVEFVKEDGKVRFEVNVAAAEKAGLKLSARLLQVGKIVVSGHGRG